MDEDRESAFAAYAAARWLTLARSAVLLGAGHHEAEDLAQTVLMKCLRLVVAGERRDATRTRTS